MTGAPAVARCDVLAGLGWDPLEISSGSSRSSEVNGDPTALIIDQAESFGAFINFDIVVAAWK